MDYLDDNLSNENNEKAHLIGTYSYSKGFSGGKLIIMNDNVFECSFYHCRGVSKSKGNWIQSGDKIVLNSLPKLITIKDTSSTTVLNDWELTVGEDFLLSECRFDGNHVEFFKKQL